MVNNTLLLSRNRRRKQSRLTAQRQKTGENDSFSRYRGVPRGFEARMKYIRSHAIARALKRKMDETTRNRMTEKLRMKWFWAPSIAEYAKLIGKRGLYAQAWMTVQHYHEQPPRTNKERSDKKFAQRLLNKITQPHQVFLHGDVYRGKPAVFVLVNSNATPETLSREIEKFLVRDEMKELHEWGKRKQL